MVPSSGKWLTAGTSDGATGYLMPNTTEYRSAAVESSLSHILEPAVPETYYLSRVAKDGVLRRAAARGRELPELLRLALAA